MDIEFPAAFQFLFSPARFKVMHGGRVGGKSWAAARALLLTGLEKPLRVLCCREYQTSMKDSVHKLLSDQILDMGLEGSYEIQRDVIKGVNGTEFMFEGIHSNITKIKSYEGIDVCWPEEAVNISKSSWDVLIPTIRKEGSEIWITFNPELETDETYQRFVVNPPDNAVVRKITWRDNPFFPAVSRKEMEDCKTKNMDDYLHIWEGECKQTLEGAIYAEELRTAQMEGRICKVPHDPAVAVDTFWDLGWADSTTIWFAQKIGFEYHVIDYYENNLKKLEHYLEVLQGKKYIYGDDWLPHDAKAKSLGTGRSIEELMRSQARRVRIVPRLSLPDGINAARTIFENCYFDKEKCADGLNALRHYCYDIKTDPRTDTQNLSRAPKHDWASHGADGFRYLAIALRQPRRHRLGKVGKAIEDFSDNIWGNNGPMPAPLGWMR